MDGKTIDIKQEKLDKLKELFPEAFTEDRVDWEKLKAALGEDINFSNERYVLNWAGKSDAFRALQVRTTATLIPDREESVNFDSTNHIFIEGENLEVLKVLQKSYYGKIKMIYIDPPYNTGNDNFIYPDRFSENKDAYLKRIGDKDEEGYMTREGLFRKNSKDSGHYHSNWLSMMYPRLFLAKNLLRNDGFIFVSIDYNEEHNLRLIMNEIFGEENYRNTFYVSRVKKNIQETEYVKRVNYGVNSLLFYAKSEEALINPPFIKQRKIDRWHAFDAPGIRPTMEYELFNQKPPKGRHWMYEEKRALDMIRKGTLRKNPNTGKPQYLLKASDYTLLDTNWTDIQESDSTWIKNGGKNVNYLKRILKMNINNDCIILDFFAGSASIAHAVIEQNTEDNGNRQCICIQLPEKIDETSEDYKTDYKTIADIAKERIRRFIKKIEEEEKEKKDLFTDDSKSLALGFKVFKLRPSNFKIWRGDVLENGEVLEKQLDAFVDPVNKDAVEDNMLFELLLKSGYNLNSKIEKKVCDKISYYSIENGEMIIALSKINETLAKEIINQNPRKVLCLDKLFAGNDQLKTNTVLQMKDAGIEFKTV